MSEFMSEFKTGPVKGVVTDLTGVLPKPAKISYTFIGSAQECQKIVKDVFPDGPLKIVDGRRVRIESIRNHDAADGKRSVTINFTPEPEQAVPGAEEYGERGV